MIGYRTRPKFLRSITLLVVLVLGAAITFTTLTGTIQDLFVAIGSRVGGA